MACKSPIVNRSLFGKAFSIARRQSNAFLLVLVLFWFSDDDDDDDDDEEEDIPVVGISLSLLSVWWYYYYTALFKVMMCYNRERGRERERLLFWRKERLFSNLKKNKQNEKKSFFCSVSRLVSHVSLSLCLFVFLSYVCFGHLLLFFCPFFLFFSLDLLWIPEALNWSIDWMIYFKIHHTETLSHILVSTLESDQVLILFFVIFECGEP